jgi:hypothetical protein
MYRLTLGDSMVVTETMMTVMGAITGNTTQRKVCRRTPAPRSAHAGRTPAAVA